MPTLQTIEAKINYYGDLVERAKRLDAEKEALGKVIISELKNAGLTQKETELFMAKVYPTTREWVDVNKAKELLPVGLLNQMLKNTTYDCIRATRKSTPFTF